MSDRTHQEQRWALAVQNAAFGVWDLDPRLETVHYSPQWKARLGFPRMHAPDSTAFWRCRVHPDDLDLMLGSLRSHFDGFSPGYEMRFRLRSNGSGYRTVLSRGRVVARDHRGDATRMIGTMIDLTARSAPGAPHGLAAEEPWHVAEAPRVPFHVLLAGAGLPGGCRVGGSEPDAAQESHRLVALIDDLLDIALREAGEASR